MFTSFSPYQNPMHVPIDLRDSFPVLPPNTSVSTQDSFPDFSPNISITTQDSFPCLSPNKSIALRITREKDARSNGPANHSRKGSFLCGWLTVDVRCHSPSAVKQSHPEPLAIRVLPFRPERSPTSNISTALLTMPNHTPFEAELQNLLILERNP
jgi:hypothetical protein